MQNGGPYNRLAAPWNAPVQNRNPGGERPGAFLSYNRPGGMQFGAQPMNNGQSPAGNIDPWRTPMAQPRGNIDPNRMPPPQGGLEPGPVDSRGVRWDGWDNIPTLPPGWLPKPNTGMQTMQGPPTQMQSPSAPAWPGPTQNQWQPGMPTHGPSNQPRGLLAPPPRPMGTANQQLRALGPNASLGQINRRLENPNINDAQRARLQARAQKMMR